MKNSKFYTIDTIVLSSSDSRIQLPRKIRVRNVIGNRNEQEFEILCSFARLIPGAKIIRKNPERAICKK